MLDTLNTLDRDNPKAGRNQGCKSIPDASKLWSSPRSQAVRAFIGQVIGITFFLLFMKPAFRLTPWLLSAMALPGNQSKKHKPKCI